MGIFEVLAGEDAETQERVAGTRAVIAAQTRAKDSFGSFVAKARNQEERDARIAVISGDLENTLREIAEEYGFTNIDHLRNAATVALGGGHASDCSCGFCENKGKLFEKDDDGDEDDETKESSVKTACDGSCGDDECDECKAKKSSSRTASVRPRDFSDLDWDGLIKTADGFSFCKCNCEGCNDGNHCESEECIESKHSGNPGNPSAAGSSDKESKTAADTDTGDTYSQERVDLPSSKDGLGGPSPKIDKSDSGTNLGWDLKPIEVPSQQHPTEKQQIHDTPDYKADLPGVSETGKSVSADSPLQPEFNTGDRTDTWTGTEGQASPVTSSVLAKWFIA